MHFPNDGLCECKFCLRSRQRQAAIAYGSSTATLPPVEVIEQPKPECSGCGDSLSDCNHSPVHGLCLQCHDEIFATHTKPTFWEDAGFFVALYSTIALAAVGVAYGLSLLAWMLGGGGK